MASTYIVLADDGRHVSLTRGAMPHMDDQREAGRRLQAAGRGGWLVRMSGDYWSKSSDVGLSDVVDLAPTAVTRGQAFDVFRARRSAALGLPPSGAAQVAA